MEPNIPKSSLTVLIQPMLADMVQSYLGTIYDISPYNRIFSTSTRYRLWHEMQRGCSLSGVKRIRVHDLRHSHASLLIELGYSPLLIAGRLGQENIETTLQAYSHLYPNKQGEPLQN
jgi:integrase